MVQIHKIPLPLTWKSTNKQIITYEKNTIHYGYATVNTGNRMQQTNW